MSDPAQDPDLELDQAPQDDNQVDPRVLTRIVALLRVAAGRNGYARVQWFSNGFLQTLEVVRPEPGTSLGRHGDAIENPYTESGPETSDVR